MSTTQPSFTSNIGCSSQNNSNCLCGPNFDDGKKLSGFIWQCNGGLEFGPKNGKTCPATVPVVKRTGVSSVSFSESLLGVAVACNTTIHPSGRPGDEAYVTKCNLSYD
jgi:hypothetical protein